MLGAEILPFVGILCCGWIQARYIRGAAAGMEGWVNECVFVFWGLGVKLII